MQNHVVKFEAFWICGLIQRKCLESHKNHVQNSSRFIVSDITHESYKSQQGIKIFQLIPK